MADAKFTIELEHAAVDVALSKLTPSVNALTLKVSLATAESIKQEALGRVARRTGLTAAGIIVVPSKDGYGYLVKASRQGRDMVPRWLEFGTRHMSPRPFLLVSAKLEAPSYPGKIAQATQAGIDDVGMGG